MKTGMREWVHQQLRRVFGVDFWRTGRRDAYYTKAMLQHETGEDAPCYVYHHSRWPMYTPESDGEFRHIYTDKVAQQPVFRAMKEDIHWSCKTSKVHACQGPILPQRYNVRPWP